MINMEITNMIFVVLFMFIFMSASIIFIEDFSSNYPQVPTTGQDFSYVNETFINVSTYTTGAVQNATLFQQNQDFLSVMMGYLAPAFNAITVMVNIPAVMMNMISYLAANTAPFVPVYVVNAIYVVVFAMLLVSVLYLIMKVR